MIFQINLFLLLLPTLFLRLASSYRVILSGASGYQRLSTYSPGSSTLTKEPQQSELAGWRDAAKAEICSGVGQQTSSGWQ